MEKRALVFPGQGAQYVGMAKDIYENSIEAKEMVEIANDVLKINLSEIMFTGPEEELKQTKNTQPAIFLHSVVLASLLKKLEFSATAGHSLGEYSALVAAGAIEFVDAIRLVRFRGESMQLAGVINPGTMAAIGGLTSSVLETICENALSSGIVQCANYNCPGQIVISGSVDGVHKAMELCKEAGARLVKELVVSGAFHSPLMQSAKDSLGLKLEDSKFISAKVLVYANVTAEPSINPDQIRKCLLEQVTAPVQWEKTIQNMIKDGYTDFVEVGPGKVLQGLIKRINPNVKFSGIDKFSDLEKFL